jgi:hypothetical protein
MLVVPGILLEPLEANEVGGTSVPPPELTRDAPILDAFEPAVPVVFGLFGCDEEFPCFGALWRWLGGEYEQGGVDEL